MNPPLTLRLVGIDVGASAGAVAVEFSSGPGRFSVAATTGRVVGVVAWPRWSSHTVLEYIKDQAAAAGEGLIVVAVEKPFTERRKKKGHLKDVGRAQGLRAGTVLGICLALGHHAVEVDPVDAAFADRGYFLLGRPKCEGRDTEHVRDACGIVLRFTQTHMDRPVILPAGKTL